jgi:hypothetical protein
VRNESTGLQPAIAEQARALVEEARSLDEALEGLAQLGDSLGVWRSSLRIMLLALTSRIPRAFCREDAPVYAAVGKAIEQSLLDLARRSGRLRR